MNETPDQRPAWPSDATVVAAIAGALAMVGIVAAALAVSRTGGGKRGESTPDANRDPGASSGVSPVRPVTSTQQPG